MKTTNLKNRWLLHLLSAAIMTIGLTACSSDDSTDEPLKPLTPIQNDDWQIIPANGGTIEKDDITIQFPSGTFAGDTKVAVTAVKKKNTAGDYEASSFYQITMPLKVDRPITVKIKSNQENNNVRFLMVEPCYNKSLGDLNRHSFTLNANYSNGEYSLTLPATNNNADSGESYLTLGLVNSFDGNRAKTRASEIQGKVGDIEWYYDVSWLAYRFSMSEADRQFMYEMEIKLNTLIPEAIKQINKLGFSVKTPRQIPVVFNTEVDKKKPDAYGYFSQSLRSDEKNSIEIVLPTMRKASELEIGHTVIHELLHYFQSEYDPRSCATKAMTDESTILSEAGSVWVEQFMNNGELNGKFVEQYLTLFLISVTDIDAVYSFEKDKSVLNSSYEKYSRHGYAMSTMLYYLTSPISEMTAFGIDKTKIVEIYKKWAQTPGTTYWPIESWLYDHNSGFLYTTQFDEYILALLTGKLVDYDRINVNGIGYPEGVDRKCDINGLGKKEFSATCYSNGCATHGYKFANFVNKEKTFKGKKVVIKQTEGKDVSTYIIAQNSSQYKLLKGSISSNDSLVISGDELNALFGEGKPIMLHTVTINHTSKKNDFGISLELKEVEEPDIKITKVTDIRFDGHLNTKGKPSGLDHSSYFGYYFRYYKDSEITFTQSDDRIHVESSHYNKEGNDKGDSHESKVTISFDITGFTGNFTNCKIVNLKYSNNDVQNWPSDKDIYWTKNVEDLKALITDLPATDTALYPGIQRYGQQGTYNLGNFTFSGMGKNAFTVKEYDHTQTWTYPDGKSETETYIPLYTDEDEMKLFIEFEYTTKKK